jgi:hypothetical protein
MLIKSIEFAHEITDVENDNVDVFVKSEDGYIYTVVVATPKDFLEKMDQEKINFLEPFTLMIIVKKLTKDILTEAIQAYAEDDAYWLKLYQFADAIDISVLDKLQAEHREEWSWIQDQDEFS